MIVEIDETVRHGPGTFKNRETGEPHVTEVSHAPKTVTVSATAAGLHNWARGRAIEVLKSYGKSSLHLVEDDELSPSLRHDRIIVSRSTIARGLDPRGYPDR